MRPALGTDGDDRLVEAGGRLFFNADNGTNGDEPWGSDGTPAGTILLKDLEPGQGGSYPYEFVAAGSRIVFYAETTQHGGEPFVSDGTTAGTSPSCAQLTLSSQSSFIATARGVRCEG